MSDLKEFRDAIDSIEVTAEQKRRMYSNIITKAEKPRRFSFPSLALKLAPVLSVCLIAVVAVTLILPNAFRGKEASDNIYNNNPTSYEGGHAGKNAESDKTVETLVIDGIECRLEIYDITDRDINDGSFAPNSVVSTSAEELTISWAEGDKLYVLSSQQAADEDSLWQLKDTVMQQLREE